MPGALAVSGQDPEGLRYQEIARMVDGNSCHPHLLVDHTTQKANAAYIVQACNAYPEMLQILRNIAAGASLQYCRDAATELVAKAGITL